MRKVLEDYGLALFHMVLGIGWIGLFGGILDVLTTR
jgi:hypothetical protein